MEAAHYNEKHTMRGQTRGELSYDPEMDDTEPDEWAGC